MSLISEFNNVGEPPAQKKSRINIESKLYELIESNCKSSSVAQVYLYDVVEPDDLYKFAELNNYLEILDSSHDLQRDKKQTNPLLEYYNFHKNGDIFINGVKISPTNEFDKYEALNNCRSQISVKNKMKELIQNSTINNPFGRIKYSDSTLKSIEKKLINLQIELYNNNIPKTIIETHRGGEPDNNKNNVSKMYKSQISTIFDLNTNLKDCMMTVFNIYDREERDQDFTSYINRVKSNVIPIDKFPLLRFYSNYFPNSFSAFITHNELFHRDDNNNITVSNITISNILNTYNNSNSNNNKKSNEIINKYIIEIIKNININIEFFDSSNEKSIYMLHMFSDNINDDNSNSKQWTFSIQKGPVTADMVTMELYGIKKRNLTSVIDNALCNIKIKDYRTSVILLSQKMCKITKDTHVIWGKTVGDGVAIETVKLISYFFNTYVALLSSDICCCYRALHNNGYAIRQHPSKLAGTGFGTIIENIGVNTTRKIEIYQNIEIIEFTIDKYNGVISNFYKFLHNVDINNNDMDIFYISNPYLVNYLLPKVKEKFINIVNKNVKNYKNYYATLLETIQPGNENTICEIIREMYLCSYITKDPKIICEELIIDYMNELQTLIDIINKNVSTGISQQRTINFNMHTDILIKLISSIEIKLQTIFDYAGSDDDIKKNVVFNLLLLFKNYNSGKRPLTNYINKIVDYISKLPEIKMKLDEKGIVIHNYSEIYAQYEILYVIFNDLYKDVNRDDPQYENRQIAKQPLNILKYLCRADYFYNSFKSDDIDYSDGFFTRFESAYLHGKELINSLPGTVPGSEVQSQPITEENSAIIIPLSPSTVNFLIPPNIENIPTTPTSQTNTNINNDPNYKLDMFQDDDDDTLINDDLSSSLNPENNYIEYIDDMDEKEKIMDDQIKSTDEIDTIVNNINRIEDPQQRRTIIENISSVFRMSNPFTMGKYFIKRGGSSIIKKQKIKKSKKHKKNKKYTIKKD